MMRTFVLALAMFSAVTLSSSFADDKKTDKKADKETKLTGKITCAKCDLGVAKACATVIEVTEKKDGKDSKVVYFFDKDANKKYHSDTCKAGKDGSVTGTTKKDGEKMVVTVKELEYKK